MEWKSKVFSSGPSQFCASAGLFVLRVGTGAIMALGHGLPKLQHAGEWAKSFPDPLGMGPQLSFFATLGAEFFCALAVVLGLATRLACVPLVFAMGVAAFVVHGNDPWFLAPGVGAAKEMALLYLVPFLTVLIVGPGRFSLDAILGKRG